MNSLISIRQAGKNDIGDISIFLDRAALIHRHLDWHAVLYWIDHEPFLIYSENNEISAILSCAPDPEGIAWIHCFAVDDLAKYPSIWQALLYKAKEILPGSRCSLCAVGLHDWFIELLINSRFSLRQNIVVLQWNGQKTQPVASSSGLMIRTMNPSDLDQVAEVDARAFEPIWVISRDALEKAYLQSEHSTVAEINGRIVGYELTTANHLSAHLARLAVLPGFTHARIGYTLVWEMIEYFTRKNIFHISVNTQDTNKASLSLYHKLGFYRTGDSFPVYQMEIGN